jgi:hypothetical protein
MVSAGLLAALSARLLLADTLTQDAAVVSADAAGLR